MKRTIEGKERDINMIKPDDYDIYLNEAMKEQEDEEECLNNVSEKENEEKGE